MRRGRRAVEWKAGGAWECSVMVRAEESTPRDSPNDDNTATTTGEYGWPCLNEGCTKGACIASIALQQS